MLILVTTTVRCVASVWGAKQQVQVASKEGAPERPSKVEPKVTDKTKKERKSQEKSTHTTSNETPKNKHLTYLH